MDIVNKNTRSKMMSGIRAKNTRPELIVRRFLHNADLRFRLHVATLPGKPDIVLKKHRAVVEVKGCFWHQHKNCRFAYMPKSRQDFWSKKLRSNVERDLRQRHMLRSLGWRVFDVWECSLQDKKLQVLVARIVNS